MFLECEFPLVYSILCVSQFLLKSEQILFAVSNPALVMSAQFLVLVQILSDLGEELVGLNKERVVLFVLHLEFESLYVLFKLLDLVLDG